MPECPQDQCSSTDPKTLHAGYVRHRYLGEDACEASVRGHNSYMKLRRIAKAKAKAKAKAEAK